jgi:ADP-ribosylation factor GTPase-activating protein 1
MDAFKAQEIERMRLGGNRPWRNFFDNAEANKMAGIRLVYTHCSKRLGGMVKGYHRKDPCGEIT